MVKDILVSIMSDDLFSRNWMSLLLVRDWRTRVVSEITCEEDFQSLQDSGVTKIDMLVVDLDSFSENPGLLSTLNNYQENEKAVKIFCLTTRIEPRVFSRLNSDFFRGYLLKDEISSSLAWAITFAAEGKVVFTPSTINSAYHANYEIPKNKIVLRGRSSLGLTDRQEEIARLAIVFSIGRRDLADELKISDQWSYGMVSELYSKLGLGEIFNHEIDIGHYIAEDPVIQRHLEGILEELGDSKKARDLETLAFHLLTMPTIEDN